MLVLHKISSLNGDIAHRYILLESCLEAKLLQVLPVTCVILATMEGNVHLQLKVTRERRHLSGNSTFDTFLKARARRTNLILGGLSQSLDVQVFSRTQQMDFDGL